MSLFRRRTPFYLSGDLEKREGVPYEKRDFHFP